MINIADVKHDKGSAKVNGSIVELVGQEWDAPQLISPPKELSSHFSKIPIFNLLLLSSLFHHIKVCFLSFSVFSFLSPRPVLLFPPSFFIILFTFVLFVNVCSLYQTNELSITGSN